VDSCVDQLHAVISEHPDNASAHYALMLAYREQGKMTEAGEEMAIFKKIQQANTEQFQNKLNALLNDKTRSDSNLAK
jgi:DNA-binding SARP family transcriptional activator